MTIHFLYLITAFPSNLFDTIYIFSYYNFNHYLSFTRPLWMTFDAQCPPIERNLWGHCPLIVCGTSVNIHFTLKKQKQGTSCCHSFIAKSFHTIWGLNMTPPGVPGQSRVFILIIEVLPAYLSPRLHFKTWSSCFIDLLCLLTHIV